MSPQNSSDPFIRALATAVAERNVSLNSLAAEARAAGVQVTSTTLSYWLSGRSRPRRRSSVDVVLQLERSLGLEAGTLVQHLEAGPELWRHRRSDRDLEHPIADEVDQLRQDWGLTWDDGVSRHLKLSDATVGDGRWRTCAHLLVSAERDGVDRFLTVQQGSGSATQVSDEPGHGCVLRRIAVISSGALVREVSLPRPLASGEIASICVPGEDRPLRDSDTQLIAPTLHPTELLTARVTFVESTRPAAVTSTMRVSSARGMEQPEPRRLVQVHSSTFQASATEVSYGRITLDWSRR